MLGVLFFDPGQNPLQLADLPNLLLGWLYSVGPFALVGLYLLLLAPMRLGRGAVLCMAAGLLMLVLSTVALGTVAVTVLLASTGLILLVAPLGLRSNSLAGPSVLERVLFPAPWMRTAVFVCLVAGILGIAGRYAFAALFSSTASVSGFSGSKSLELYARLAVGSGILGSAIAVVGVAVPFLGGCTNLSLRRIWAVTVLSFKEGVRRRVLYVFSVLLVVLMFASWFINSKPEDQVRTYVSVVDLAMTPLMLFAAVLVASFSIPTDIRQQTIHTILTKPVERFEIVLGRFFGYVGLMTVILVVLNLVGVLYVLRGIDPEAAAESLKARDPWYGVLTFEGTKEKEKADSVGREWEYRSYISGPMPGVDKPPTAVWSFPEPSATLAGRDKVRCEFAFDIYRTTKGYENRGVGCSFVFTTWKFKPGMEDDVRALRAELRAKKENLAKESNVTFNEAVVAAEIEKEVARSLGFFEIPGKGIADYHTLSLDVPGALFANAIPTNAAERQQMNAAEKEGVSPVTLRVRCLSSTQYVGMARYDLYLRQDSTEGSADRLWFAVNFFKGGFGLWLRLCLVIGLAVCLSTYLSGVVSLLIALLVYAGGLFREFIEQVAVGANIGGGPLESILRLATRSTMNAPLEDTATKKILVAGDQTFRDLTKWVLNLIPDVARFDLTPYVAEGFDLPLSRLLICFVVMVGYLLPWFVLAFFLMKGREVASAS